MSFTLCTSGAIIAKMGANASTAASTSGALLQEWADEAEARVAVETLKDWVASYADVSTNTKKLLSEVTSSHAAMNGINYDMANYTSRQEAEIMLDVLYDKFNTGIQKLKEKDKAQAFMI